MDNLGIDLICVLGMHPTKHVELAAELGCRYISLGLDQLEYNPFNFPRYSLVQDATLRRELKASLQANGVTAALAENLYVMPDTDSLEAWKPRLEALSELGVPAINSVSFDPNLQRNIDQYGKVAELTAAYGIRTLVEFVPIFGVPDLASAMEVVRQVGRDDLGLMIDTMHIGRTGLRLDELAAIPSELVGYIQLCDVPLGPTRYDFMDPSYMDEASHDRLAPGDGELPLVDYLRVLPKDVVVGLEIPQRRQAEVGKSLRESVGHCVEGARKVLAAVAA